VRRAWSSSGLVQTILTTFVAVLITWAVTPFQQRKRLAWRDYLDSPVNLDPQQASRLSSWKILCQGQEVTNPSLECEEPSTLTLLHNVAAITGAIGYVETSDVAQYGNANIQPVEINGLRADIGAAGNGAGQYHFWTVEYLYSYGSPPGGSLASAFI